MKKYLITAFAATTVALAGCGGMSQDQMMMMDEMKSQMDAMQFQVNSNEVAAARAKEMAEEALIKASRGSSKHTMHRKNMMK